MTDHDTAIIRVYNVGFGDSILVDLPSQTRGRIKLLIDCGSVSFGESGQNTEGLVRRIITDITDADGVPRLDVVVATHRHRDHVSGFARNEWQTVQVREVWQPWTEDPHDPEARRLRGAQLALAQAIVASEPALAANPNISEAARELILAMGANAASNDAATSTLRTGFASNPRPVRRYLSRQEDPLRTDALDGLTVHVLGPMRDVEVLHDMDPPSGQSYLALLPAMSLDGLTDPQDANAGLPFAWLPKMTFTEYGDPNLNGGVARRIGAGQAIGQLRRLVETDSLLSATVLDHALNNTSLMLILEVGDQFLLFPGDSQWGSWNRALNDEWSATLLAKTTFYKVGHHGSHNATPVGFVTKLMPDACWAVASVAKYSRWEKIPKPELIEALQERSPGRVFTTMKPPTQPPHEVTVLDDGLAIEFRLTVH